ncbi:MAG: hypothetical protein RI566_04945 [Sediminimonas sp.]|uniref:hypothetical protein n=1 Tax=Sediminimonas sp. TaxID=2823379 RepID=UPI0028707CF1|nr:hypothetical protein [Sediminimonas sp.]MDR9484499.1 hypothetical protein [Sediminimonas sp.]
MRKLVAIANVIAWSGFWAFGYLAITAEGLSERQLLIAAVLAGFGFLTGIVTYLNLSAPKGATSNNPATKAGTMQEG